MAEWIEPTSERQIKRVFFVPFTDMATVFDYFDEKGAPMLIFEGGVWTAIYRAVRRIDGRVFKLAEWAPMRVVGRSICFEEI